MSGWPRIWGRSDQPGKGAAPVRVKNFGGNVDFQPSDLRRPTSERELLDAGIAGCMAGDYAGLVTGPVQKSVIADSGVPFSGHTEYLAELGGVDHVAKRADTHIVVQDVVEADSVTSKSDFDGGGTDDILWRNKDTNSVFVWTMESGSPVSSFVGSAGSLFVRTIDS